MRRRWHPSSAPPSLGQLPPQHPAGAHAEAAAHPPRLRWSIGDLAFGRGRASLPAAAVSSPVSMPHSALKSPARPLPPAEPGQKFGDVEADAAGADDGDRRRPRAPDEDVDVADARWGDRCRDVGHARRRRRSRSRWRRSCRPPVVGVGLCARCSRTPSRSMRRRSSARSRRTPPCPECCGRDEWPPILSCAS